MSIHFEDIKGELSKTTTMLRDKLETIGASYIVEENNATTRSHLRQDILDMLGEFFLWEYFVVVEENNANPRKIDAYVSFRETETSQKMLVKMILG